MPAHNWRFGATAAVARMKGSGTSKLCAPRNVCCMLPLRQAALTLCASGESAVERAAREKRLEKKVHLENLVKVRDCVERQAATTHTFVRQ